MHSRRPSHDMTTRNALFYLTDASFTVPGRTLLHPTSATFSEGCMTALIGHNGSGKSTLLKLLARQLTPSSGAIAMHGRPLSAWGVREFARAVAYLPQQLPAGDGMTVEELVAMGRYPWHGALGRLGSEDRAAVRDAMALTGVTPMAGELVAHLSGGERQRCWLAMLVAQRARCLLLDEPTSALDIGHQLEVLGLLRELTDAHEVAVVIVLHDVNLAARFCDEIVALRGGHLFTSGTPDELMTDQTLEAVYGVPMAILAHPTDGHRMAVAR